MTPEQSERLNLLCSQIAKEQDHVRFHQLVKELNELLDEKDQRLGARGLDNFMRESRQTSA